MSAAKKIGIKLIVFSVTFFIPLVVHFNISAQSFHTVNNKTIIALSYFTDFNHFLLATILLLFLFFTGICYFLIEKKKFIKISLIVVSVLVFVNFICCFFSTDDVCFIIVAANYIFGALDYFILFRGSREINGK